jgi:hypothetical protein
VPPRFPIVVKSFHQPDVIDERRFSDFIRYAIPNAPPLAQQEEKMLGEKSNLQKAMLEKGKRIKGNYNSEVEKYQWTDDGRHWGAYSVTVDSSAESLLAHQFIFDTYGANGRHQAQNGNLPRSTINNVDGTRGALYRLAVSLPKPYRTRIFEGWQSWKFFELINGKTCYLMGVAPLTDYQGSGLSDINLKKEVFKYAEAAGLSIISEIAPEVCRITR